MKRTIMTLAGLAAMLLLIAGCGTETGTNPLPEVPLGLSVGFDLSTPTITVPGGEPQKMDGSGSNQAPDSVTVTSGLMMVRSVRMTVGAVAIDTVITAADEDRDKLDASVLYHGPYVFEIGQTSQTIGEAMIPAGSYDQMTFVLQKARATDDLGGHDELVGSSLRVSGKVWRNGVGSPFTYSTDYTSEFVVNCGLDLGANNTGSVDLTFAAGNWFHSGSRWLDPNDPTNNLQILKSIRRNISGSAVVN